MTGVYSHSVLYIDDRCEDFLEVLMAAAAKANLNLYAEKTVLDGLDLLGNKKNAVQAVILDLGFPHGQMQGMEGLKFITREYNGLPVIVLTGGDTAEDIAKVVECMKKGAYNYVGKNSFNPDYLFQMITAAIKQYHVQLELTRHQNLKKDYQERAGLYKWMLEVTELILKNIFTHGSFMFEPSLEKRVKDFESFYTKVKLEEHKRGMMEDPFKRWSDLAGFRVIFYNYTDLKEGVRLLEESDDFIDVKGNADLVADDKSKAYGYRAVHFDLKLNPKKRLELQEYKMLQDISCEVQFKTVFAHSWSKVYHAMGYKNNEQMNEDDQLQLDVGFKLAAKKLEDVEEAITQLCAKFFPGKKNVIKKKTK
jgi:ppGpp synthetase/RelA/SpoT-type nucleotidyltranferase/CheY-like chemotaxis protein